MKSSLIMIISAVWGLMAIWLGLVSCAGLLALRVWRRAGGLLKKQMLYVWVGTLLVFIGDFVHTVAFTISKYTDNPTGPITVGGSVFEFRTFAMFFDGLAFIIYYGLWALFVVARYQGGVFSLSDKVRVAMAAAAAAFLAPGAVPNAFGLYSLSYNLAAWSPHMVLFIIFGPATIWKLTCCARAQAATADAFTRAQERALFKMGICLLISFGFFALTIFLLPFYPRASLFMMPKTFAYMGAFYFLISGFLLPEYRRHKAQPAAGAAG